MQSQVCGPSSDFSKIALLLLLSHSSFPDCRLVILSQILSLYSGIHLKMCYAK